MKEVGVKLNGHLFISQHAHSSPFLTQLDPVVLQKDVPEYEREYIDTHMQEHDNRYFHTRSLSNEGDIAHLVLMSLCSTLLRNRNKISFKDYVWKTIVVSILSCVLNLAFKLSLN